MSGLFKYPIGLNNIEQSYEKVEDFLDEPALTAWTTTASDSGTAAVSDAPNGILVLTPGDGTVTDNDEIYVTTANELFLFAQQKPFFGQAVIKFVETVSGVFNMFFGFANAIGANFIIDDGTGLRDSGSIAGICKLKGETTYRAYSRSNTNVVQNTLSTTLAGGSAYQKLEVEVVPYDGQPKLQILYRVNGVRLKDALGNEIKHTIDVASATEMQLGFGAKLGAATNNDTLSVDWVAFAAARV